MRQDSETNIKYKIQRITYYTHKNTNISYILITNTYLKTASAEAREINSTQTTFESRAIF